MSPRPQLSLCVPLCSDKDLIQEFAENTAAFFQKFPLVYEVLYAVGPNQDQSLPFLQYLTDRNPQQHIIRTDSDHSRSKNLEQLFKCARGDILVVTDLDLAVPLSETFKMLEVFYSSPETEVVFGDRAKAKKNLEKETPEADALENFFSGVIKEKTAWRFQDPFCPTFGIRKKAFEKLQDSLQSSGWHWTPEMQRAVMLHGLAYQEIPLYVGTGKIEKPPRMMTALELLKFVLFRI